MTWTNRGVHSVQSETNPSSEPYPNDALSQKRKLPLLALLVVHGITFRSELLKHMQTYRLTHFPDAGRSGHRHTKNQRLILEIFVPSIITPAISPD